jgi:hypothetical protein
MMAIDLVAEIFVGIGTAAAGLTLVTDAEAAGFGAGVWH